MKSVPPTQTTSPTTTPAMKPTTRGTKQEKPTNESVYPSLNKKTTLEAEIPGRGNNASGKRVLPSRACMDVFLSFLFYVDQLGNQPDGVQLGCTCCYNLYSDMLVLLPCKAARARPSVKCRSFYHAGRALLHGDQCIKPYKPRTQRLQ